MKSKSIEKIDFLNDVGARGSIISIDNGERMTRRRAHGTTRATLLRISKKRLASNSIIAAIFIGVG